LEFQKFVYKIILPNIDKLHKKEQKNTQNLATNLETNKKYKNNLKIAYPKNFS
jgi:hypothetical protein